MDEVQEIIQASSQEYQPREIFGFLEKFAKVLDSHPQSAPELLPAFENLLSWSQHSDVRAVMVDTFTRLSENLSSAQCSAWLESLPPENQKIFLTQSGNKLVTQHPDLSDYVFSKVLNFSKNCSDNDAFSYSKSLAAIVVASKTESAPKQLAKLLECPKPLQKRIYAQLGKLGARPELRPLIYDFINNYPRPQSDEELSMLCNNINRLAKLDRNNNLLHLEMIRALIENPHHNNYSLTAAYGALKTLRESKALVAEVDKLVKQGLQSPGNNAMSRKVAYRCLGEYEQLCSQISIGQRVEKSEDNPLGWQQVDSIKGDEVCVLFLGGDGTTTDKRANGYLKNLEGLLEQHGVTDKIGLYSVVYDFGSYEDRPHVFESGWARKEMMSSHHRNVKVEKQKLSPDTLNPRYVEQIFTKAFAPRICDDSGQRYPIEKVCENMRKLNVVAHCHGAYTFLKLEEKLQQKMNELGYTQEEQQKIFANLLCTAHAPYCPLGVSKSKLISFCSANDDEVWHYNHFQSEVGKLAERGKVQMSYFPAQRGEFFLTLRYGDGSEYGVDEHNFQGYDANQAGLTKEGRVMLTLVGNVIVNGIKSSLTGAPLPAVKDLVCGGNQVFEQVFEHLRQNGEKMYQQIYTNARQTARSKAAQTAR